MKNNIHLGYFGASGGFLVLHLLLLSGEYSSSLNDHLDTIIQQQWNIKNHLDWKDREVWPDNNFSDPADHRPKLFFHMNPDANHWKILSNRKLFLYTDLKSQLALSKYKRAFFYNKNNDLKTLDINYHFVQFYNNIKDSSWPDCNSISDSFWLDNHIQQELNKYPDYKDFLSSSSWEHWMIIKSKNYSIGKDTVYDKCIDIANNSNGIFKLQDIVNSNGSVLFDYLGIASNKKQIELIHHWKSLHTRNLLEQIGIDV